MLGGVQVLVGAGRTPAGWGKGAFRWGNAPFLIHRPSHMQPDP